MMPLHGRPSVPLLRPRVLLVVAVIAGCRGGEPGRGNDTAGGAPSPPPAVDPARPVTITWDTAAGFYFAIPADRPGHALLVDGRYAAASQLDTLQVDSAEFRELTLELQTGGDVVSVARIANVVRDSSDQCAGWPLVALVPAPPASALGDWHVAFTANRARPAPVDSLPSLASADSVQRVVAVARAASKVEGDTAAAFRGRPFVVRQANRADFGDRAVVVAEVVRTVQQEADPRQEQLLLVLERGDTTANGYEARYHERTIALEEAIESVELVAAFRAGRSGTPSLLLRRESEVGALFILLQRSADGAWVVRWRSATDDC